MDCPHNIEQSASQLFYQNKGSPEFKALLMISTLPHPQRPILASFVLAAANRDTAAQFMLDEISGRDPTTILEFLADWTTLATKVRPALATGLDEQQKQVLRQRDGFCRFSRPRNVTSRSDDLLFAFIVSPNLFNSPEMNTNSRFHGMLEAFIGKDKIRDLRFILEKNLDSWKRRSERIVLLSKDAFRLFENGLLSMKRHALLGNSDSARYIVYADRLISSVPDWVSTDIVSFEDRSEGLAMRPNPLLFEVNHRFSRVLSWMEVAEYMKAHPGESGQSETGFFASRLFRPALRTLQHAWRQLPVVIRSYICRGLTLIGHRLYGAGLSNRVHRLPFGLYLRVAQENWGPRHQAEFESLLLIERYTTIPAPRPVDTFQYEKNSYLLMTRVPGQPVGTLLNQMTDEQLQTVARELSEYIAQLRRIRNTTSSGIQVCNSLGAGIFDWRIGDSQHEELKFATATEFHQYLTAGYSRELQEEASQSHNKNHDIVFTHGDLNLRNILVDETGKITGIVDWECSGWYPEYWEYTKAYFTVRHTIRWLVDVIDQLFTDYREELWVENMLTDYAPHI